MLGSIVTLFLVVFAGQFQCSVLRVLSAWLFIGVFIPNRYIGATLAEITLPAAATVELTCTDDDYVLPRWILQGQEIDDMDSSQREELGLKLMPADTVGRYTSITVCINGSSAIHDITLQCKIREEFVYNTTLLYQG